MRRLKNRGLGLLITSLLVLVLSPAIVYGRKAVYPVYFTFTEDMGIRRFLQAGDPGYKNDSFLRKNPGLEFLPKGSIVQMNSDYASQSTRRLNYFNAKEKADSTRFVSGFKVLYAPGWTAEQIAAVNAKSDSMYMIRSSVVNQSAKRTMPAIPAIVTSSAATPSAVVETQVAPVQPVTGSTGAVIETQTAPKTDVAPAEQAGPNSGATAVTGTPAANGTTAQTAALESSDPVYLSTNDKIGMRLKSSDGTLASANTYLPKGSVIKISPGNLESGENLNYAGGKGVKRDFVTGIEVLSAPGMTHDEIAALNSQPLYMAQSFVKEGDVIAEPTPENLAAAADNSDTEAASADNPKCETGDCMRTGVNTPEPLPTTGGLCDGVPAEALAGCQKFLKDKSIPQDALAWTLKVYKQNLGLLKMNKCILEPPSDHYSVPDDFHKDDLRRGIQNKCQVMINDTRAKYGGQTFRGTYHFLNLCSGDKRTGYFNMGTGTFRNNYQNKGGKRTTLLGAFLTANNDFLYKPNDKDYRPFVKRWGGAPAVALFGLQNTNNTSANNYKYMHVSPYRSSWGCPSVSPDDADLIKKLADNGPSLVVNYGPEKNMEDPSKCTP